jgi:hypothetical protein
VIVMASDEPHASAENRLDHTGDLDAAKEAARAFRNGPIGALVVASIAVGLLLLGWLAFYFLLFLPRGPSG